MLGKDGTSGMTKKSYALFFCLIFLVGCGNTSTPLPPLAPIILATTRPSTPAPVLTPEPGAQVTPSPNFQPATPLSPTEAMGDCAIYLPIVNAYLDFEASQYQAFDRDLLCEDFLNDYHSPDTDFRTLDQYLDVRLGISLNLSYFAFDLFDFGQDGTWELVVSAYNYRDNFSTVLSIYTVHDGKPMLALEKEWRYADLRLYSDGTLAVSEKYGYYFFHLVPETGEFTFADGMEWAFAMNDEDVYCNRFSFYPDPDSYANKTPIDHGLIPDEDRYDMLYALWRDLHGVVITPASYVSPFNAFRYQTN